MSSSSRSLMEAMAERKSKYGSLVDRDRFALKSKPDFDALKNTCDDMADDIMIDLHEESWEPFKRNARQIIKDIGNEFEDDDAREKILSMNISDSELYEMFKEIVTYEDSGE